MPATPFERGGQRGWRHDEGHPAGVFETYDRFDLGFLGPRKVHVLVPPGPGPFATVVLHDGDTAFWPGGVANDTWDVAGTLSALRERVEPLLVVAIHPVRRDLEYTHADWLDGEPWGELPRYAAWLASQVKPWIDAHYPTDPARSAIVGSSHGGLASFWAATRHPRVFQAAGCLSPSFFTGLDDLRSGATAPVPLAASALVAPVARLLEDPRERPRLWLDWGTERGGGRHNAIVEHLATLRGREMASLLRELGYRDGEDLFVVEDDGAGHDERAWRRRFGWLVRALFPARV